MTTSLEDFEMVKRLGDGAYSTVYKVIRKSDNQCYAMKKIKTLNLSSKEKENAINEVRFLASINSPFIIGYKETFFDEKTNCLHIIMEYAAGGDLLNKIRNLKKKKAYLDEKVV
jgi:NIMA (never in mitosis gene a)-related kinase